MNKLTRRLLAPLILALLGLGGLYLSQTLFHSTAESEEVSMLREADEVDEKAPGEMALLSFISSVAVDEGVTMPITSGPDAADNEELESHSPELSGRDTSEPSMEQYREVTVPFFVAKGYTARDVEVITDALYRAARNKLRDSENARPIWDTIEAIATKLNYDDDKMIRMHFDIQEMSYALGGPIELEQHAQCLRKMTHDLSDCEKDMALRALQLFSDLSVDGFVSGTDAAGLMHSEKRRRIYLDTIEKCGLKSHPELIVMIHHNAC